MAVHRFTVNVPNPSDKPVVATLRLERSRPRRFKVPIDIPNEPLQVLSTGLTLDACGKSTANQLRVKIGPLQSVDIHVIAEVSGSGNAASAAFNVSDERGGRVVGGVTLVCVDRVGPERPGSIVIPRNPCPVTLAGDARVGQVGGDPAKAKAAPIVLGTTMELVIPITNPTAAVLPNVQVYLEHLGISAAAFQPATWNVGSFRPKDIFLAAWNVNTLRAAPGAFHASVVALSEKHEPVRLQVPFRVQPDDRRG